jgi:heme-degrading monooxygenase HmoA
VFARATQAEIDTVRTSIPQAVEVFCDSVLPALHGQEGFQGVYLMVSPEGKALVLTFWDTEEAAEEGLSSGFYDEQVAKFVTVYRASPGRTSYEVLVAERPTVATG